MSIPERCSMCGEMNDSFDSNCIFRLMKDEWSYRESWEEVFVICEGCFVGVIMGQVRGRVGEDGKTSG